MVALCPPQLVSAPLTTAPRYGLYSVATVLDDPRASCGVIYLPEAVAPSGFAFGVMCGAGSAAASGFGAEPGAVTGDGFWVITGTRCFRDDIEAETAARMALNEGQIVENQIWTAAQVPGLHPEFDASSTPVLSGSAVSLAVGVGLLEVYLGSNYDGQGVIHSSRVVAPPAALLVSASGGKMTTLLGTPWAFGQGYAANSGPGGTSAPVGEAWLYATGQVVVRRGPIFASTLEKGGLNRSTNDVLVIAERPVNVTIDGILAAVHVTL